MYVGRIWLAKGHKCNTFFLPTDSYVSPIVFSESDCYRNVANPIASAHFWKTVTISRGWQQQELANFTAAHHKKNSDP
jgi:hypothetical protein